MTKPLPVAGRLLARPLLLAIWLFGTTLPAEASLFKGEALDTAADVLSWIVMILVPIGGLWLFWLVHVLPEKIAEKKGHPQAPAIKMLCLLSLVFGGMLWPIAWLWAYTKPVMYKLAYGTDYVEHHTEAAAPEPGAADADKGRAA